jgi:hypothetical protein
MRSATERRVRRGGSLVRARAKDMGIEMGSRLGRVIDAPSVGQAMREITLGRGRGLSL